MNHIRQCQTLIHVKTPHTPTVKSDTATKLFKPSNFHIIVYESEHQREQNFLQVWNRSSKKVINI